jgi:hypothetical protein
MRMLPDSQVKRSYLVRGARLWAITRAAICVGLMSVRTDPFHLALVVLVAEVGITVAVYLVDAQWHREPVFLVNRGTTYELGPPALATAHEAFREEYPGSWFSSPAV